MPFGFWYFGHLRYITQYFRNFVAKSDQKRKTINGMNETFDRKTCHTNLYSRIEHKNNKLCHSAKTMRQISQKNT